MRSVNPNYLFTLRVPVFRGIVSIHAYQSEKSSYSTYHTRIDVEVLFREVNEKKARMIFELGDIYCGLPAQYSFDGIYAKELVMSLVATSYDADPNYTPEQIAFVKQYGEELDCIRQFRYCDANGNVREERKR